MLKLQSDFLGPYFVDGGRIIRPMAPNTLRLAGELTSRPVAAGDAYTVSDLNDDEETWRPTMKEIVYLEAKHFLKVPDFERFVCLASGAVVCRFGRDVYPQVTDLFPNGYSADLPQVKSNMSLASVIERSYFRRLAENHFMKARAIRDGDTPRFGMSTDVMTRKGK